MFPFIYLFIYLILYLIFLGSHADSRNIERAINCTKVRVVIKLRKGVAYRCYYIFI